MKSFSFVRLLMITIILTFVVSPFSSATLAEENQDRPWMNTSLSAEQRAQLLVNAMTLEDKVDLITGNLNNYFGYFNNALEKYGIPELRMADAALGIRLSKQIQEGKATAMPAIVGLAATWNPETAKKYGELVGNEAFNTTHNILLGPAMDIARNPFGGRNFESYGEDPLLTAQLAVEYVKAAQSQGVMATAKHYLVNNQELNRFNYDAQISKRAINEIYARPYGDVIKNADVASVMCAYNKVNSVFACESDDLMNKTLRGNLGFNGFVMSDYHAVKTTVDSLKNGLDMNLPGEPGSTWGPRLVDAVKNGQVSEELVTQAAYRVLYQMFDKGLFDNAPQDKLIDAKAHGAVARQIAAEAMVLLQNKNNILPLKTDRIKSIAVIGPDADNANARGGGSSIVTPTYTVSPLEGIKNRAGKDIKVEYIAGTDSISPADIMPGPEPVPSAFLSPSAGSTQQGLKAVYWSNHKMEGEPVFEHVSKQVNMQLGFYNYDFNAHSPKLDRLPGSITFESSARYTGVINVPKSGDFMLSTTSLGSSKVYLDGNLVIDNAGTTYSTVEKTVRLEAGKNYAIQIDYKTDNPEDGGRDRGGKLRFGWKAADDVVDSNILAAVELAKKSDVAIIVTRDYQSEGNIDNTTMRLPNNQNQLIREVSKVNKNVIVVNETGNPVEMKWNDSVAAIVQAWFPGQEQGNAIADVLFGDVNPSGKLPVTFPMDVKQTPVSAPEQYGKDVTKHTEGAFVGYRGFEKNGIKPAFSFGHGLSYTDFDYKNLKTKVNSSKNSEEPAFEVTLHLRNTGDVTGSEVVQVYAGQLPTKVETAPKQLAGFQKVKLEPGKQTKVTIKLDPKSFSYFDEDKNEWVMPSGEVPVYVGSASDDIRLQGTITVSDENSKNFNIVNNAK
jgi:beta-glucosidase